MDYSKLRNTLGPCLQDNSQKLDTARQILSSITTDDAFDKRVITVFTNLMKTLDIAESFKRIARNILNQSDFFSDSSVHHTTKAQQLKQTLEDDQFLENNKRFSISTLQAYVENILNKQLLEINIKIEENQRLLHNLEKNRPSIAAKGVSKARYTKYLFVENERIKYTIRYAGIVEILKPGKGVAEKNIQEKMIPYSKVAGLNRRNVLKSTSEYKIQKNQPLININAGLNNTGEKQFAVITRKENYLNILFVDNILYTDPVEAQDMGAYAKTFEGNFKTIEV